MEWNKLFKGFFESERTGGILLLLCTVISLTLANSYWGQTYTYIWHRHLDLSIAGLKLAYTVEKWINDGLMTLFFLLAGLEIRRELRFGELSTFSTALLPMVAAVGGMIVPAGIHFFFNTGTATQKGFGIPMATDIAFALGMSSLAGNKVPYSLKIFLTALAIIDDLGAVFVIAAFYNNSIQWFFLGLAAAILSGLYLLNKARIYNLWGYLLPGIALWYCILQSGIHPTFAGVLLAFVLPSGAGESTPAYKLQRFLHKPVGYFIVPLFALANTAIVLKSGWLNELTTTNSLGILIGLTIGKPAGILSFCWLLLVFTKSHLPRHVSWKKITGAAFLGGIGFTMSIFISNLAFQNADTVNNSKIAVLLASFIATCLGLLLLFTTKPSERANEVKVRGS